MCGPRVMGAPRLSSGDPQMSASVHLSFMLARFFRKSPAFAVDPSGRYSGESTETLTIQPVVFHSTPPIFNELPHSHLHCVSLSVLESTPL